MNYTTDYQMKYRIILVNLVCTNVNLPAFADFRKLMSFVSVELSKILKNFWLINTFSVGRISDKAS